MGFLTRKPTTNERTEGSDYPWAGETETMDLFALQLNDMVARCDRCRRWTRRHYLIEGRCPDCQEAPERKTNE